LKLDIPYYLENYIGGNLIGPLSGKFIENINPATGELLNHTPDSDQKDVDLAVHAASTAFSTMVCFINY
jgi:aminomuconate-semialdehyde/2-hydroxymuconate-6-semialdehyde dehydrogenase